MRLKALFSDFGGMQVCVYIKAFYFLATEAEFINSALGRPVPACNAFLAVFSPPCLSLEPSDNCDSSDKTEPARTFVDRSETFASIVATSLLPQALTISATQAPAMMEV
jgi:hypothetical protein